MCRYFYIIYAYLTKHRAGAARYSPGAAHMTIFRG